MPYHALEKGNRVLLFKMTLEKREEMRLGLWERIPHFTWAWFSSTMSTGGLALALAATPHQFNGLHVIGTVVFILTLILFILFSIAISIRFWLSPSALSASLHNPTESLFFPTFLLTIATIIINSSIYGEPHAGPWLVKAIEILFWIYCGITICSGVLQYYLLFTGKAFTLQSMTPGWLLPILPATLVGTMAGTISPSQPPNSALSIIVGGLLYQGLGWWVSVFMFSIYISRLMGHGLPAPNTRPGMFVAVGPPCELRPAGSFREVLTYWLAFTVVALINLADAAAIKIPNDYFTDSPLLAGSVLKLVAGCTGLFIWLMAFWFFAISLIATVRGLRKMSFHLTWWAVVFPNVAFTLATVKLGDVLHSPAISWVTTAMTILLAMAWIFVAAAHIEAIWSGKILWPGKDEDRHGLGQLTCAVSDCPQCLVSTRRLRES